jgi:uncharacterized protein (DUF58 family)
MPALIQDIVKTIRRIQIVSTQLANDVLAGAYRSAFKGRGIEFEEVREFQTGDEIRSVDWNVTARMNYPYVKNFTEERDLTVFLIVDVSASSRFGGKHGFKSTIMAEIGAVLAFSAIKNNDKVGLILFSDIIEKYIPPGKGVRHVLHVIRELLVFEPTHNGSDLKNALDFLGKIRRQAGICFIISDFLCPEADHEMTLASKANDLISIFVTDPYEETFPNISLVNMTDLETGKSSLIDTSTKITQKHLKAAVNQRKERIQHLMQKLGAGFIYIQTDQPYALALRKFFKLRQKKQR